MDVTLLVQSFPCLSTAVQFASCRSHVFVVTTLSGWLAFMNYFVYGMFYSIISLFSCHLGIGKPLMCVYYFCSLPNSPTFSWLVLGFSTASPQSALRITVLPSLFLCPSWLAASRTVSQTSGLTLRHQLLDSSDSIVFGVRACVQGSPPIACGWWLLNCVKCLCSIC